MQHAIGIVELSSIAKGMAVCDHMLKSADVGLLISKTLCPGKYLLMVGGEVGAVTAAVRNGEQQAGHLLVDSQILPNIHGSILPALSGLNAAERRQAVGVVETWSVAACIHAADNAVKAAAITLVRIHMAYGIGGKCYLVLTGDITDVQTAVDVASQSAGEKGLLVHSSVISRPHEALWRQLVQEA